ncbi:mannitol dehydrogenase family protein [Pendulispora albinea]|uniref:Mannitol dehydrogenase family protein n=1 Tax=Pendulispora albinea TaxID=2741071 RepID=A0ABZ2LW79_9BACT
MQALNRRALGALPPTVVGPSYERKQVRPGIAHIGVGAFHRAHLAIYVERALARGDANTWGILGINLLDTDRHLASALNAQDGLYTVTEMAPDGSRAHRVIGAMVEYRYAPDSPNQVLARLADPAIRIVSLTITEGGYLIDDRGRFKLDDAVVAYDLAHRDAPRGVFGFLIGALALRRRAGAAPFTVMSCDNLRHNGDQTRRACLAYAQAFDPTLASWIAAEVDFPNAMVDRITPATDPARRAELNAMTGLDDRAPVVAEDFIQWVLEDKFRQGRPRWEEVGVQMVSDVTPYEEAKIRLLNGAHQMLSYPAFLSGLRGVDEALREPLFHDYLRDFLAQDSAIWLESLPGMELESYERLLLERFGNRAIADRLDRLCLDGGSKIPGFLLPTLEACLANNRDARRLAFLLACYDRYLRAGKDDGGTPYPLREPNAMRLLKPIIESNSPLALLQCTDLVGPRPAADARFKAQYLALRAQLDAQGARATLAALPKLAV